MLFKYYSTCSWNILKTTPDEQDNMVDFINREIGKCIPLGRVLNGALFCKLPKLLAPEARGRLRMCVELGYLGEFVAQTALSRGKCHRPAGQELCLRSSQNQAKDQATHCTCMTLWMVTRFC